MAESRYQWAASLSLCGTPSPLRYIAAAKVAQAKSENSIRSVPLAKMGVVDQTRSGSRSYDSESS